MFFHKKVPLKSLFLLLLCSCSAAFVPQTDDPDKKLHQVHELIRKNRGIPAEKLANEAFDIFEKRGDRNGMARAYDLLGTLYRTSAAHHNLKLPQYELSSQYYERAASLYLESDINNYARTMMLAALFTGLGTKVSKESRSCKLLAEALSKSNSSSENWREQLKDHQIKMRCL